MKYFAGDYFTRSIEIHKWKQPSMRKWEMRKTQKESCEIKAFSDSFDQQCVRI